MFFSHMDSQATARSSRPSRAKCWPMRSQAIWVALMCSRPYRIDPFRAGSASPDRWQRSAFSGMLCEIDYRTCRRRYRFLEHRALNVRHLVIPNLIWNPAGKSDAGAFLTKSVMLCGMNAIAFAIRWIPNQVWNDDSDLLLSGLIWV
jgi:hypothetical protein